MSAAVWSCTCARSPCDGLDCGVYLPGRAPRRAAAPKSAAQNAEIRARAWATRRMKATTASANGYEAAEQRSETLTLPKGTEGNP